MRENIRFLVFWARLTSLRMMFSNSIHTVENFVETDYNIKFSDISSYFSTMLEDLTLGEAE
jgi:hypothetical protein